MNRLPLLALGVAVTAALTWFIAWWTVPIVGAALGLLRRDDPAAPLLAGLGAMLAWGLLLLLATAGGPVGEVLRVTGAAMRIGPAALLALTLAFAALLGSSAAALVRAVLGGRNA